MTTTTYIGQIITIGGTEYSVTAISEDKGHLGSKFYGKRVFTLRNRATGDTFTYFGKRPTANARLTRESN